MRILSIETSCDETSLAYVDIQTQMQSVTVLSHITASQIDIHQEFGGVFPALARREHAKSIVPILEKVLTESGELVLEETVIDEALLREVLSKEAEMAQRLLPLLQKIKIPNIDYICVTHGPGLEPALWVGINFATALSTMWNIPLIPVNHMEGHIYSIAVTGEKEFKLHQFSYPYLALLISGGHTELVLAPKEGEYQIVGETKDDALGEAFDKVARMMDLPYPGGPEISRLAQLGREQGLTLWVTLPRPMINSGDTNFSFSGLKTAVLYALKEKGALNEQEKIALAMEFENAVTDVVIKKVFKVLDEYQPEELVIAGGVSANRYIRKMIEEKIKKDGYNITIHFPHSSVTGDNALMITLAGYKNIQEEKLGNKKNPEAVDIRASGNLRLS